jgi:membrane protein implicated in regulation of membrane protease activity
MTWADFYLICFAVGFAFSFLSFILGGFHSHVHLPGHLHAGPHLHLGHGPGAHGAAGHPGGSGANSNSLSPFNLVTLAAFLAWFGGTGYLLTRFSAVWFGAGLVIALLTGVAGAGIIYAFLSRVLMSREENLDPADYDMVGVLGRLSMPIRSGGTGELIYSQAGTRRTCGARTEDGNTIEKGTEVVVTRYDRGIAYVRPWTEVAGEEGLSDAATK